MRRPARRAVALGLALLCGAGESAGRELWRRGEARVAVSGSLREIATATGGTEADDFRRAFLATAPAAGPLPVCVAVASFPACPAFDQIGDDPTVVSLTRLRLRLDARWSAALSASVVYDQELQAATRETFEEGLGAGFASEPFAELAGTLLGSERLEWRHGLYRAFARYESGPLEVVVGRQRVPWGVGRLWNPIDRFNPIGPLAIEADQSPGVDAARARWSFSGFTFLEAVYAAGRRGKDRDAALRFGTLVRDVDASVMAGVFDQAPSAGFDLAANLGDAAGRLEVVWTDPRRRVRRVGEPRADDLPAYWQVVASVDHSLDVGSGLYVLLEYLYNGNALGFGRGEPGPFQGFFQETDALVDGAPLRVVAPGDVDLFGSSGVVTRSRHLLGAQLGYDLTPELRGDVLVILDAEGGSASAFPALRYGPLGWLELTLGVQLFAGPRRSEFGTGEPLVFLLAEAFF